MVSFKEDPEFVLVLSLMVLLSVGYVLHFYNGPNANAAEAFLGLNAFGFAGLLYYQKQDVPLRFSQNLLTGQTIPYDALVVFLIYLFALITQAAVPASTLPFIPSAGSAIVRAATNFGILPQLATASTSTATIYDVIGYNTLVATGEESFKIILINFGAIYLLSRGIGLGKVTIAGYDLGANQAVWGAGAVYVGVWVGYHEFQAFSAPADLLTAFGAGMLLLWLVIKFQNLIPAIATHASWNIITSISPYCLIQNAGNCTPTFSLTGTLNGQTVSLPIIAVLFGAVVIFFFVLKRQAPKLQS